MLILYPFMLMGAGVLAWRRRGLPGGRGPAWFLGWMVSGFLVGFSIITGLSIGILITPVAVMMLFWAATKSPHLREGSGFFIGIAATIVLFVIANQ